MACLTFALPAGSADLPIAAKKLVVVDRTMLVGSGKMVFVASDASITKGSGADPGGIEASLELAYVGGATSGRFSLPVGAFAGADGWKANGPSVAKYVNQAAPAGPTDVKVAVVKPGKLIKVVAKDLGAPEIDVVTRGAPGAGVTAVFTVTNGAETNRHCAMFADCSHRPIAADTGAKLVCRGGLPTVCPVATTTSSTATTVSTTSTTTTTTAPGFARITKAATPTVLYVIPTTAMSSAERVMVATLQGIVGGIGVEQIWIDPGVGGYPTWLADLASNHGITTVPVADPWWLADHFAGDLTGYLLWQNGDDSVNAATSLAGTEQAIAIEASIEAQAILHGLGLALDVRGMDEATVVGLYGHLLNPLVAFEQKEAFEHQLRDYAALSQALCFYDGNSAFRDSIMASLPPDGLVLGWGDAGAGEDGFIGPSSDRGVATLPADHAHDLTPLSGVPTVQQAQPGHGGPAAAAGKHHAAFLLTDGDNVQWLLGDFQSDTRWFASPVRGTFDVGYGIAPALVELAPSVMGWYYANASNGAVRDVFVAGPSGGGYMYPSRYPGPDLDTHVARLADWMSLADLRVAEIIDFGSFDRTDLWDVYTARPEIEGLVYLEYGDHAADEGRIVWSNGKPVVSPRAKLWAGLPASDEASVTALLGGAPRDATSAAGYSLVVVHVWSKSLADVKTVVDALPPDVVVVTPEALVDLVQTNVPHDVTVSHDYTGADFGSSDLALVGNAAWVTDGASIFAPFPNRLRLTSNGGGQVGSAWSTTPIDPSQSWSTTFRFQITFPVNGGADGLGFHVQGDGMGGNPGHEGGGLSSPRLSVVLDTWNNGPEGTDESLKVIVDGSLVYLNDLLDFGPDPNPGSSTTVFRLELDYMAALHRLAIRLHDEGTSDALVDSVPVDLDAFPTSYVGFSATTGASTENHDVRTWSLAAAAP